MNARRVVVGVLALSVVMLALQAVVVRPYLWPAGAGLTLSGDQTLAALGRLRRVAVVRPPDVHAAAAVTIEAIQPGGPAEAAGLVPGQRVLAIASEDGVSIDLAAGLPADAGAALRVWRDAYWLPTRGPISLTVEPPGGGDPRVVVVERRPAWRLDAAGRWAWLEQHLGALVQVSAFLAGALALVALGTRGTTAALMTLALIATGVANGGPLLGAEAAVPFAAPVLLLFGWLVTPLAFPVIGLAVLFFPHRAEVLERHPWIYGALAAAAAPMLIISLATALFLLGVDAALPALAWLAPRGWTFDGSFVIALAANVLIVLEGIERYRTNPDVGERRRIQIVVFTGVPAVFAYAIKAGVPLVAELTDRPLALPWPVAALLQAIVLLPAFGLPYAVAVRHVFSPRTVLRRSLQYALARRTLRALVALPALALAVSLYQERARPLSAIVLGQPLFYAAAAGLLVASLRMRDRAQSWLDRRFFRAEYDAREILVALASRVPYEQDPRELVALVVTRIDAALHPESVGVLAGDEGTLMPIAGVRSRAGPLAADGALATLLRWSDEPLEVFLDDERSPAGRLPAADRAWLTEAGAALLVPVFAGTGDGRTVVALVALGQKRSEEPYTAEDRRLLSAIAAQMSVALDLSRLRRRADSTSSLTSAPTLSSSAGVAAPTVVQAAVGGPALGACPVCRRCLDVALVHCPDDGHRLEPVAGLPPVVDGKYRVDAVVGRGGMGAVFRARDLRLERDVAIKVVRADLIHTAEARARFRREAQIVARLQHPAIVTVFDYGNLADGAAFLVMEYVRGEDLRHLLRRERTLDPARVVTLVSGIADGVDAAHREGIFHRDLKPENILLPAQGSAPKVLDFGVAKLTEGTAPDGTLTGGGTIVGTPAYMAPEQIRGEAVDARADVFSLGVMAYEALTGQLPYGGGSFIDVALRQSSAGVRVDAAPLPAALREPVLAAIALAREARPPSASALADGLRRALG